MENPFVQTKFIQKDISHTSSLPIPLLTRLSACIAIMINNFGLHCSLSLLSCPSFNGCLQFMKRVRHLTLSEAKTGFIRDVMQLETAGLSLYSVLVSGDWGLAGFHP